MEAEHTNDQTQMTAEAAMIATLVGRIHGIMTNVLVVDRQHQHLGALVVPATVIAPVTVVVVPVTVVVVPVTVVVVPATVVVVPATVVVLELARHSMVCPIVVPKPITTMLSSTIIYLDHRHHHAPMLTSRAPKKVLPAPTIETTMKVGMLNPTSGRNIKSCKMLE